MTDATSHQMTPDSMDRRALLAGLLQAQLDASSVEIPLTYGQQAVWFLHQLAPESGAYNVSFAVRVRSSVDGVALRSALQGLVQRHAPLRTTYAARDAKPVQVIHTRQDVTLKTVDAAELDDAALDRLVSDAHRAPFDLERGPLFRATLFTRDVEDHVLLLVAHHIAVDGWSVWVLLDELGVLYAAAAEGSVPNLAPLKTQYADYVRWQNAQVAGAEGERMWAYWREQLAGELPVLDLPTDRPRPPLQTWNGATVAFELDEQFGQGIRALARSGQTTAYTVMLAAYQVLLHRYSGQDDILVGSPTAGRNRAEFTGLVGDFINTVVLRGDLSGDPTFRTVLAQTRETVLAALQHQDFPFALLVQRLAPRVDPSRSPIFQAAINFHNVQRSTGLVDLFVPEQEGSQVNVGGLLLEAYPLPQQEGQFDLMLQIIDTDTRLYGKLQYNIDLFDAATIGRMAGHYQTLLAAAIADPDRPVAELSLLSPSERSRIVEEWNDTVEEYPAHLAVHQLIEEQVDRTPGARVVRGGDETLSYLELDSAANRLAHYLRRSGVEPGTLVGICLERSPEMLVALLAVLKAGYAYLPLDPEYPAERRDYILRDSAAGTLLTASHLLPGSLPDGLQVLCLDLLGADLERSDASRPAVTAAPDDLAYVIYTSGSTGRPKGVEIPHQAVVNFLSTMRRRPGLSAEDVLVAVTTIAFDIALLELFLPLAVGAEVVLADRDTARDGRALLELLRSSGATVLQATPVTFRMLLHHGAGNLGGLRCFCGGEPLPGDLARALIHAGAELWNMYGPTETTVWSAVHQVQGADTTVPVGRPIGNTQMYILDSALQVVPEGVIGELYIGGDGVARGYRQRPELTAERFVPDLFGGRPGMRLYRTGDEARYLADGTIVVLGRTDRQVKLRGHRIEPGEIESVLTDLPEVGEAVVQLREDRPGEPCLVAYLTFNGGARLNPGVLRASVRERLPEYMTPAAFVPLDALPRTPNGKIDVRALPAPFAARVGDAALVPPATATERMIAGIVQNVLSLPEVSMLENFFNLGGHSIQAVEMIAAIEQRIGVRVNPAFIQAQTLGQLATLCDEMVARGEVREPVTPAPPSGKVASAVRRVLGSGIRQGA